MTLSPRPLLPSLSTALADLTERHGAITASKAARCLVTSLPVDTVICAAIDELRRRGRDGLASQLAATRFAADEAVAS